MPKRYYVIFTLLINGVVPWLLYEWLSGFMSTLAALSIATLVPLADNLVHLARHRRLDAFGGLMLFTFVLTLILVLLGGDEKLLLIRESLVTAAVGILFLGSLLFGKPILFHLAVRFIAKGDFAGNWKYPYFRFVMRLMSFVWGIMLTGEAAVRVAMAYTLSTERYLALSNFVLYGFIGAATLWTLAYRRRSVAKLNRLKREMQDAA